MWNTGSLYNKVRGDILAYNNMYGLLKVWEKDKDKAHDDFYETSSSNDSGPKEYQSVEHIRDLANRVLQVIQQLIFSLQTTKGELPILKKNIEKYINVVLNGKKGNANSIRREIISMSKIMYERNFPHGINHNTFRIEWLLFWIFVAGFLGFAIAYGLKRMIGDDGWEYRTPNRPY